MSWLHLQTKIGSNVVDTKDPMMWTVMTRGRGLHSNKMFDVNSAVCHSTIVACFPTTDDDTAIVHATVKLLVASTKPGSQFTSSRSGHELVHHTTELTSNISSFVATPAHSIGRFAVGLIFDDACVVTVHGCFVAHPLLPLHALMTGRIT